MSAAAQMNSQQLQWRYCMCNAVNIKVYCEWPQSQNAYITVSAKPVLQSASPGEVHCPVHIDLDLNIVIHTEAMRVNGFNMKEKKCYSIKGWCDTEYSFHNTPLQGGKLWKEWMVTTLFVPLLLWRSCTSWTLGTTWFHRVHFQTLRFHLTVTFHSETRYRRYGGQILIVMFYYFEIWNSSGS